MKVIFRIVLTSARLHLPTKNLSRLNPPVYYVSDYEHNRVSAIF